MSISKDRFLLWLWGMVVVGLFVPILPHLIVPLINPRTDMGLLEEMLLRPVALVVLCLWTAVPFVALALAAKSHLSAGNLNSPERFLRTAGIIGSFIFGFGTGFICHAPRTGGGVNFGVILFPIYMIVVMPLGYFVGRMIGWIIHNLSPNIAR